MNGRYWVGGLLIILGLGFLLDQVGAWNFSWVISTWWPLMIIAMGVVQISIRKRAISFGIILILIGLLLQANELNILHSGFWAALWPLMLVLIGIWILTAKLPRFRKRADYSDNINYMAFFSGVNQKIENPDFKGGSISAMFGGAKVDLRHCRIMNNPAVLELNCAFGGIELLVPASWKVVATGTPFLGGFDNKTMPVYEDRPDAQILKISYFAAFGGIDVKN